MKTRSLSLFEHVCAIFDSVGIFVTGNIMGGGGGRTKDVSLSRTLPLRVIRETEAISLKRRVEIYGKPGTV